MAEATAAAEAAAPEVELEDARSVSLMLQQEVVNLWKALRCAEDEACGLRDAIQLKDPQPVGGPTAVG